MRISSYKIKRKISKNPELNLHLSLIDSFRSKECMRHLKCLRVLTLESRISTMIVGTDWMRYMSIAHTCNIKTQVAGRWWEILWVAAKNRDTKLILSKSVFALYNCAAELWQNLLLLNTVQTHYCSQKYHWGEIYQLQTKSTFLCIWWFCNYI